MSTEAPEQQTTVDPAVAGEIVTRSGLRALIECCKIIEDGISGAREVDLGMMTGAGIIPGPLARADAAGLDNALAGLEHAAAQWGEAFAPPVLLRRLVAQGRLGRRSGQGFFAYPRPDSGDQTETVLLETRDGLAIAWLSQLPVNPISPQLVADLQTVYDRVESDSAIGALVIASSTNAVFSAGADLKAFSKMTPEQSGEHVDNTNSVMRAFETGDTITIACVNGAALGGGCELAMACDLRIAGESASFAQPEIGLGLLPGFGGTQRLSRITGKGTAFELIVTGDTIDARRALEIGLVNQVVPDHELFDAATALAGRLARQSSPAIALIKRCLDDPTLDSGLARERESFVAAIGGEDAREGISAFLQKRAPRFSGR